MSSPYDNSHRGTGDYPDIRRRSLQHPPGRLAGSPALPESTNANQELVNTYNSAYRPQASIDGPMDFYPTGTPNTYQQGHSPTYQVQGTIPIPYASGQSTRDTYSPHGVNAQWTGHHLGGADFHRSASWPPQPHIGYSGPPNFPHGSASVTQMPGNGGRRREVVVPQRPYVPHHRQNYFDQFNPEGPITFHSRSGQDGIALTDVLNGNFDYLIGRDDPMFPNYAGPAVSLRLEWPGYKSWTKQIKTKNWRRDPEPITKSKLAIEVAKKVQVFIQDSVSEPIMPGSERWRVGQGFIEVKDLVLVRLVHVSKGSWQAEFRATE